jgi:hypothetical protein
MSPHSDPDDDSQLTSLDPADLERVIALCDRFEAAWKAGQPLPIETVLANQPEHLVPRLLCELLAIEAELRRRRGDRDPSERLPPRQDPGVTKAASPPMAVEADLDPTLTYTVVREDGSVASSHEPGGLDVLAQKLHPGMILQDRYRLEDTLGGGGMGLVFLGRDARLDRPVAVKVIQPIDPGGRVRGTHTQADLRAAFLKEAQLGANLLHPAIATVFDYGFHEENPFTVFEYVEGPTLKEVLKARGSIPLEEVRLIVGSLAQALDFAHAKYVVHRDLKPANIKRDGRGNFKILDLGLATEFRRQSDWSFCGTPAYASPEQAAGLPADGRADQYALALITWELLAGQRPFNVPDGRKLLELHRSQEPPPLRSLIPDVPQSVENAIRRALSKDPAARFANCTQFAVAIGCQLLSAPTPVPEILLEADVERMTVGRHARWVSFPWFQDAVHLVLTREALWSAYHSEVRCTPLAAIERLEPRDGPVDDREAADLPEEDEEIFRRTYRGAEANIRAVGRVHLILLVPLMLILAILVGQAALGGPATRAPAILIAIGVFTALGAWLFAVSRGLRQLRPWARWAALTGSLLASVLAVGGLLSVVFAVVSRPTGSLDRLEVMIVSGLLFAAMLALAGYMAGILLSRNVSVVFTGWYAKVIEQTPFLAPRPAGFEATEQAARRTARLTLRAPCGHLSRVAFRFAAARECEHWAGRLAKLAGRPTGPVPPQSEAVPTEPAQVVLLRQRPIARYQLLGTAEAKAAKRRTAEAGLQIRAAMMGADAVVDLQEEFLPGFHQTIRRLTGTAVRAVDTESRFEFRSHWYANRIAWVSTWAFVLLLISLALGVFTSIVSSAFDEGRLLMMTSAAPVTPPSPAAVASNVFMRALRVALIVSAIHLWPIGLVALVRGLLWPQFVRPLALTLVAFALRPVYLVIGLVAGAMWSHGWSGLMYHSLYLLDPVNLSMLVFGLLVGRAAWRADREFRQLVPAAARKAPLRRALGGGLSLAASVTYAVALPCIIIWGAQLAVARFRLPTPVNRTAASAMAQFRSGAALLRSDPARAGDHFRKALPLWEALVREVPSEVDYRINLEATRTNLALTALALGRLAESREELARCAAGWEALGSVPLPAAKRAGVNRNRDLVRNVLGTVESALGAAQALALHKAGDDAGAEVACRRALELLVKWPGGPSLAPAIRALRDKSEAAVRNDLAWLFAVTPGRTPEQVREAVTLAERAIVLDPEHANFWNTLGLARYRANDCPGATSAIERSMRFRGGGDAFAPVILTLIKCRQSDRAEARRWYDEATTQFEQQRRPDDDLRRLREEAASLLELPPNRP